MTDETTDVPEVAQDIEITTTERVFTQIEQEEMARGWKPDGKKSAEEFRAYRDEYNNALDKLKAELREQKKSVEFLLKNNAKLAEEGYQKALETLRQEQADAALIGDAVTVKQKTDEIIELSKKGPVIEEEYDQQPYIDFIEKHKDWYVPDLSKANAKQLAASQYANKREFEIRTANPTLDIKEVLQAVEDEMKIEFPTLFKNKITTEPVNGVVTKSQTSLKSSSTTYADLPKFHQDAIAFMRQSLGNKFDEAKYIQDLKAAQKSHN